MTLGKKFDLIEALISKAKDNLECLSGREDSQALYLKALYVRGIELAESSIWALKEHKYSVASILLRSLLEVYVDFANLVLDKKYFLSIEAGHLGIMIKRYEAMIRASNGEDLQATENLEKCRKRMKLIRENGGRELNIFQRFKKIDHEQVYREIYSILSDEVHGSYESIQRRHIGFDSAYQGFYVAHSLKSEAYKGLVLSRVAKSLTTMSMGVHVAYKTKHVSQFKEIRDKI